MSNEKNNQWKRENTVNYSVRFTKSSGIPDAIKTATEKSDLPANTYVRQAIVEKLQRDGYIKDSSVSS